MAKKKKITPEELLDIFKSYIPEVTRQAMERSPGLITEQTQNVDGIWNTTWQCGICGAENFSNRHLTQYSTLKETCEHCESVIGCYEYKNICEESHPEPPNRFNVIVETADDTYCIFNGLCRLSYASGEKPLWKVKNCVLTFMAEISNMLHESSEIPSVIQYRNVFLRGEPKEWKSSTALIKTSDIYSSFSILDVSDPDKFLLENLISKTQSFQRKIKHDKASVAACTRAKKKADEISSIPELHKPFPCPDEKELLGILTFPIERNTVSDTFSVRARCLECGSEWLFEQNKRAILVECPYCGNMRKNPISPWLTKSHRESRIAYISVDGDMVKIRVTRVCWDDNTFDTGLHCEPLCYYEISKDNKTKGFYYSYGKWSKATKRTTKSNDDFYNFVDVRYIDGADTSETIKYSGLIEYLESEANHRLSLCNLITFLEDSLTYPIVEKLIKGGFITEYKMSFDSSTKEAKEATTLPEFFGLPKGLLKAYKEARTLDFVYTPTIDSLQHLYLSFPDASVDDLIWCFIYSLGPSYINNIVETVPHLSVHDIVTYLERVRLGQFFEPRAAAVEWSDYLDICSKLDMDMHDRRVLYPRALKTEHDIAVSKQVFVNDSKTKEAFNEAVECYKELEYSKGDYLIKVPTDTASMLEEGRKLKHCCGRYVDDVAKKKAFVLFLRKKENPETPYLSIEVLPDRRVRQVRGLNDTYVSALPEYKEVNLFLTYWAKSKKLKLDIV